MEARSCSLRVAGSPNSRRAAATWRGSYAGRPRRGGGRGAARRRRLPASSVSSMDPPFLDEELEVARMRDLTPRESEILALLAGGSGTRQIAGRLVISEKTVKTHVQNILRKLGAASRLEAAAIAIRAGHVPVSAS